MAELQPTDLFLVNRSNVTSTVTSENLMATILDDDLLLVNRENVASTITGADVKESLGNKPIFPEPDEITSNPAFQGGTGTETDPFLLQTIDVRPGGATGLSVEEIIIAVAGATEGDLVVWTDNSVGAGTRFTQPTGAVGADGTWSGKLVYNDSPATTVDTDYTGNLQIGEVYFRWIVEQGIDANRPVDPTPGEITSEPDFQGGSGTVDDPYILETQTCAPAGSNISSIEQITIAEVGAGPNELVRWYASSPRFEQPEGLTDVNGIWTGRLVYNDTPDTAVDQTYVGDLHIGTTYFRWSVNQRVLASQPPVVAGVSLVEASPAEGDRFTSQSFIVQGTMAVDGIPTSVKTIDAHVDGTLSRTVQFDEPLESSTIVDGTWTSAPAPADLWLASAYGGGTYVAVGGTGSSQVMYSTDEGLTWTKTSTPAPTCNWTDVTFGNGTFVAVGYNPAGVAMYSTDGIDWYLSNSTPNYTWRGVTYGNGKFVAVPGIVSPSTGKAMYSTDGIDWFLSNILPPQNWQNVTYGNGRFVATSGTLNVPDKAMYSTDAIDWTLGTTPSNSTQWQDVAYGDGKFVAVTSSTTTTDKVMYSTDGSSWTETPMVNNLRCLSITYGNGKFVAVGLDGVAVYSSNGINWTDASPVETSDWRSVTYGNGKFVAVGSDGTNPVMWSYTGTGENTTALIFADGTNMEALAGGDTVNQTTNFTEPLESSGTTTAHVYSDYLTAPGGFHVNYPAPYAFDEIEGLEARSATDGDTITFTLPGPLSGTLEVWCSNIAEIVVYDDSGETRYTTYRGELQYLFPKKFSNITSFTVQLLDGGGGGSNTKLRWVKVNGIRLIDGETFTELTFATGTDMSELAVGDTVSQGATTGTVGFITGTTVALSASSGAWVDGVDVTTGDKTASGTVASVADTTATLSSSSGNWVDDVNVSGPEKTIVEDNSRLYCVFDSNGNITDLQNNPQDPAYTTTDNPADLTLTFPATFPSGQAPDDELPDGTTLTVNFSATNASGTSGPVSATVQPEAGTPVAPLGGLTTLYDGNSAQNQIINGIDCVNNKALTWFRGRKTQPTYNFFFDTERGEIDYLNSSDTWAENQQGLSTAGITYLDNGVQINPDSVTDKFNSDTDPFVNWTFGAAPGYFDVVEYTGTGGQLAVPHSLAANVGMMIVKKTDGVAHWTVYHSGIGAGKAIYFNEANAAISAGTAWNSTTPTDAEFFVGNSGTTNATGGKHIAYLFAEDTPDVIKSGSFVSPDRYGATVTTGFTPQWLIIKSYEGSGSSWLIVDSRRGDAFVIFGNTATAEAQSTLIELNSDGFTLNGNWTAGTKFIYVAIAEPPAARSQTSEEFAETQLKMLSYKNRKEVICGETATAERDALIQDLVDSGYTLSEVLEFL